MTEDEIRSIADLARSTGYRAAARRRLASLTAQMSGEGPVAVCRALMKVLGNRMSAATLSGAVSAMRTTAAQDDHPLATPLRHPLVTAFIAGKQKLEGPPVLRRGATPISRAEYTKLRDSRAPLQVRQAGALMWVRAARFADIQAMRTGAIWRVTNDIIAIECGAEKTSQLGLARQVELSLPRAERRLLSPLISPAPPKTRPASRGPLLPITRALFIRYLRKETNNPTLTTHSFRRGAVKAVLESGLSASDARLLTGHRTVRGFAPYATRADAPTRRRLTSLCRALAAD